MYHKHHTKGFVISREQGGDHDYIVFVLTKDFGVLRLRVSGARKMESKFRSGCQQFSYGDFSIIHGKNGWKIVSVRNEGNIFEEIKVNREKSLLLAKIFSLIVSITGEEDKNERLFDVVYCFYKKISTIDNILLNGLEYLTIINILKSLGYVGENDLNISDSDDFLDSDMNILLKQKNRVIDFINQTLRATNMIT